MLKALPYDAKSYIAHIIRLYWRGEINPEEWHITTLTMLYKGKGNQHDLKNWRGICLKEMTANVVNSIMATRLLTAIDTSCHSIAIAMITIHKNRGSYFS
jgi:hypothetical protein